MESLSAMESRQKDDCMILKCMDCKGVTNTKPSCKDCNKGVTSTEPPRKACKKEYKCGTACPVGFKLF